MSDPALLAYVLGEVALDGREGCTLDRLYGFIEDFTKRQPARKVTLDNIFDPDADNDDELDIKKSDDPTQYHEAEILDDDAKEKIWEALKADQDFSVGRNNEGADLSWKQIREDDARRRQKRADGNIPDSNDGIPVLPQEEEIETQAKKKKKKRKAKPESIPMGEYEVWRVYTTEEKQWMTLTGHGIDRKKVPPTVFDLLAVIGKCRHAGILQPDLTRAAGQDPRSSSARTTLLAELGYIEKRSVLAARLRTSILTLKRFIAPTQAETIFLDPSKAKPKETEQKGQTVDINVLTREIFRVLGEAKNKTLMHCDLKKKLGMDKDRFHFRAFARMIRRMEQAGYVKRILVPIKLYNHPNARKKQGKAATEGKSSKGRPYHLYRSRCVRLEREPGEDWADFMTTTENQTQVQGEDDEEADDNASDIEDVSPEQEESAAQQINEALEGNAPVEVVTAKPKPDWRIGVPIERITYEKIEASGMSGISSMDLHATIVGPHYYRPLDQVLLRLTKNPYSQPFFLADKRIIRETDVRGRNSHYRYFTHPNHQKLVSSGMAEAPDDTKKKNGKDAKRLDADEAIFGDWGFPVFNPQMYLSTKTCGTLADAQRRVLLVEDRASLVGQCRVIRKGNGCYGVDWASQKTYTSRMVKDRMDYIGELDYSTISFPEMRPLSLHKAGKGKGGRPYTRKAGDPGMPFKRRGRPPKPDHLRKFPKRVTRYREDGSTYIEVVGPGNSEGKKMPAKSKDKGKGKKAKALEGEGAEDNVEMADTSVANSMATPTPAARKGGPGRGRKKAAPPPETPIEEDKTEKARDGADDKDDGAAEEETPRKNSAKRTPAKRTPTPKTPAKRTPAKKTPVKRGTKRAADDCEAALEESPAPVRSTGRPQRSAAKRVKFGMTQDDATEDDEVNGSTVVPTPTPRTRGGKPENTPVSKGKGRGRKKAVGEEIEGIGQEIESPEVPNPNPPLSPSAPEDDTDDSDLAIQAQLLQEQKMHEAPPVAAVEAGTKEITMTAENDQITDEQPAATDSTTLTKVLTLAETPRRSNRTRRGTTFATNPTKATVSTPSKKRPAAEIDKEEPTTPVEPPNKRTRDKATPKTTPKAPARASTRKTRSAGPSEVAELKDLPDPSPRKSRRISIANAANKAADDTIVLDLHNGVVENQTGSNKRSSLKQTKLTSFLSAKAPSIEKPAIEPTTSLADVRMADVDTVCVTVEKDISTTALSQAPEFIAPPARLKSLTGRAVLRTGNEKNTGKSKASETLKVTDNLPTLVDLPDESRSTPLASLSANAAVLRGTPSSSTPSKAAETSVPETPLTDSGKTQQVFDETVYHSGGATLRFMPPEKNKHPEDQRYGRFGGMLNLSRRQTIMELVDENGGVFPGGIELRHAFAERYKQRNPEAGVPDRRLIVNVLNSLQEAGLLREIMVAFHNSRGFRIHKRILVRNGLSPESPQVVAMKDAMIAADGALWWPEGTAIPSQFKNIPPIVNQTGSRQREAPIEVVDFDRLYETETQKKREEKQQLREQRKQAKKQAQRESSKKRNVSGEYGRNGYHLSEIPKSKDSIAQARRRIREMRRLQEDRDFAKQREEAERRARANAQFEESVMYSGDERDNDDGSGDEHGESLAWWADFLDQLPEDEEDDELDMNQLLTDTTTGDFVNQHKSAPAVSLNPKEPSDFFDSCQNVLDWEMAGLFAPDKVWQAPWEEGQAAFINLYCPPIEVGSNFDQEPICIAESRLQRSRILGPDVVRSSRHTAQEAAERISKIEAAEEDGEPYQLIWAKKRKPRKRDEEMARIHRGALDDNKTDKPLNEVPTRERFLNRQRNTFTSDEDLILFCGVTIVRTLFGGLERYINWNLVWKLFPNHTFKMVKQRWPRVRVLYKSHLAVLQADFERLYLADYEKGLLPEIDENDPMGFDIEFHTKWLKDRLVIPDKSTSDSPLVLDSTLVYGLRQEPTDWRETFHNSHVTMGNRFTQMLAQPFVAVIGEDISKPDSSPEIDNIKSLIKSNIITDEYVYDQSKACALLKAVPTEDLNRAFHEMANARSIVPKKSGGKVVPGRNYEFTDIFHAVFKTQISEKMFKESLVFEEAMDKGIKETGEFQLTPFIGDGQMMMVINKFATGQIRLNKSEYKATKQGLITGYRTRMMDKRKLDFQIFVTPTENYALSQKLSAEQSTPPTIKFHGDCIDTMDYEKRINRVWIDTNGKLVVGMWNKARSAIMANVLERPGITVKEMTELLGKAFTIEEVKEVVGWFVSVGAMKMENNGCWALDSWWKGMRW